MTIRRRALALVAAAACLPALTVCGLLEPESGPVPVWKSADLLNALYTGRGITPDKSVVTYCYSGVHSCVTYFSLRMLGYPDVRVYTGSWDEWILQPYAPREMSDAIAESEGNVRPHSCARCSFEIS